MNILADCNSFKEDMEVKISTGSHNLMEFFTDGALLGKGSYWTCTKAQRHYEGDDGNSDTNTYVFKKGALNATLDEIRNLFLNAENSKDVDEINETRIGIREAKILANVKHPHIARLYEINIDTESNINTFVCEFCNLGQLMNFSEDGENYEHNRELLIKLSECYMIETEDYENKSFLEEVIKVVLMQLCDALEYLHNKGIAHLDLKPDNVLFKEEEGTALVKLNDFSISRKIKQSTTIEYGAGLEQFKSPQRKKFIFNPFKDDVYCIGLMAYLFVTCSWETRFDNEVLDQLAKGKEEGSSLRDFLESALEEDEEKRPTVADLKQHPWFLS